MKVFEYRTWLLCKDLFDCRNCIYYKRISEHWSKSESKIDDKCHFSFLGRKHYVRLVDFKVCSKFVPLYYLKSIFNYE